MIPTDWVGRRAGRGPARGFVVLTLRPHTGVLSLSRRLPPPREFTERPYPDLAFDRLNGLLADFATRRSTAVCSTVATFRGLSPRLARR